MNGVYELVPIDSIDLDVENPRIAHFLEHHEGEITAQQVHFALMAGSGDEDQSAGPTFHKLKQSIQTNKGIVQPIILTRKSDGRYSCVEGNTRVFLYKEFREKGVEGSWDTIPSIVHSALREDEVHAIRLQAHLVGPRAWDPYSKAKYLNHLRNEKHFTFSQLIDLCGGNKRGIQESLDAYDDIEKFYRPVVGDSGFELRKFSGFVELQKPGVKKALLENDFSITEFSEWIATDKILRMTDVRKLSSVLKNEEARNVFLDDGMDEAVRVIEKPPLNESVVEADIPTLCSALRQEIDSLPFEEFRKLKENPGLPTVQFLQEVLERIAGLLSQLEVE